MGSSGINAVLPPRPRSLIGHQPRHLRTPGRSQNNSPNTRFFTGNQALDSAAAGAALGLGASVLSNQILNPCRGGTMNSNQNQNTNTRIFGNNAATNGIFGAVAGFLGGQVAQNYWETLVVSERETGGS